MKKILYHGNFITMDESQSGVEAVLIEEGRITAVGCTEKLRRMSPDAKLWDMEGRTVLPGFVDGHSHIAAVAQQLMIADLKPSPAGTCNSVEDVILALRRFMESGGWKPGAWVMGMGYDNSVYPGGAHPTREDLDRVSKSVPVLAVHISGHLCAANSKALEALGYTGTDFRVPEGGVVEPSGLLKEQAFLETDKIPRPSLEDTVAAVKRASMLYASYGITTAQDGKTKRQDYELLKAADERGYLLNDVVCYFSPEMAAEHLPRQFPEMNGYHGHIRPGGLKFFLDGSPQGKTAWLSEPYLIAPGGEPPDYRGFGVQTEAAVMEVIRKCLDNHWQINVHANGDEAIEQMIRCYGKAIEETGSKEALRPVIIHCQTVREDQLERMNQYGILASFFLDHVFYWGDYHYESVLGPERAERISPLQSAMRYHIPFTLHQDSPVVPPDMMFSVHNAVNRRTVKGRILGENQKITVMEALRAVTMGGAYQIFEDKQKGSITPKKAADFVVLDRNPLEVLPEELKEIRVLQTIKNGTVIYRTE